MNYTNQHNLPERICRWLAADDYDYDQHAISAAALTGPARAWALKCRFGGRLQMDYSDLIALRCGSAIHDSRKERIGGFPETRYYAEIAGFTISGKVSALVGGAICDARPVSVWKFIRNDFSDCVKQLSICRYLLHRNGIEVAEYALVDLFFTDWKKPDSVKIGNYPPIRYREQRIELWSVEETEEYITGRLLEFAFASCSLPECSAEELWKEPASWAVYRKAGQTRAFRILNSREEAVELAGKIGGIASERPSKAKRCNYCTAAPFCEQYSSMKKAGTVDDDERMA